MPYVGLDGFGHSPDLSSIHLWVRPLPARPVGGILYFEELGRDGGLWLLELAGGRSHGCARRTKTQVFVSLVASGHEGCSSAGADCRRCNDLVLFDQDPYEAGHGGSR